MISRDGLPQHRLMPHLPKEFDKIDGGTDGFKYDFVNEIFRTYFYPQFAVCSVSGLLWRICSNMSNKINFI